MKHLKLFENFKTDTNQFKKWFGDSKIVDDNGNPREVYHGSGDNFNTFKMSNQFNVVPGFYFSDSMEHVNDYGHNIYKVFLKMERPYVIDAGDKYYEDIADNINRDIRYYYNNQEEHDGIIIQNIKDTREGGKVFDEDGYEIDYDSSNVYVVFNSNQIKSSTDNNGYFSDSDNIFEKNVNLDYILSDNDRILDYAEEYLEIDNFDKDDDIFIDNSYDIEYLYRDLKNKETVTVYRLIKSDSLETIDFNKIGIFWSFNKDGVGAYDFAVRNEFNKDLKNPIDFIFQAEVKVNDIDWRLLISSYLIYGEEQSECSMKAGSSIVITHINDEKLDKKINAIT